MIRKRPKKKRKIIEYETFINDKDGISAKDYLLIISTAVFFGFVIIGLILALGNVSISDNYMELLNLTAEPLMVIVGGIMGVQAVEVFANRNRKETVVDVEKDDMPIEQYNESEDDVI